MVEYTDTLITFNEDFDLVGDLDITGNLDVSLNTTLQGNLTVVGALILSGLEFSEDLVTGYTDVTNAMSPYSVGATDFILLCDVTGGAITVNLPAAASNDGRSLIIKNTAGAIQTNVTVTANGAETIDGNNSITLANHGAAGTERQAAHIICDGTEWHILSQVYDRHT